MTTLQGQRVLVMGLGNFGGGSGCAGWLHAQGASVTVTDLRPESELGEALASLPRDGIAFRLGGHDASDFRSADLIVVNPAVPHPWSNPYLNAAREAGVALTTEIRLLTANISRDRCIGITGTAGKSTTASMTHHLLTSAGVPAVLGGNIGGSLLPSLAGITPDTWVVLELSSAQLHWLGEEPAWSPRIAGTTNVLPNHIDWHETEQHYRACKELIHANQRPGDRWFDGEALEPPHVPLALPGKHNRRNAALATALASATGTRIDGGSLQTFSALPHRLCPIGEGQLASFIDDSKSTTPEATILAVESLSDPTRIHLIAGGYDKGVPITSIARCIDRVAGLYTIGATGAAIAEAAGDAATPCGRLAVAVDTAMARMAEGDVLLLSPGCASWDQFTDYRARGEAFASLVSERLGAAAARPVG